MMYIMSLTVVFTFVTTISIVHAQGGGPEFCVVPTTSQVRPHATCSDTTTSSSGCLEPLARVNAQIGETEDIQLLLRKSADKDDFKGGLKYVSITVNGLPSFVTVSLFRVGYVWTEHTERLAGSGGGWRPDPLMPIQNDTVFDIPADVAQPLWISLSITRAALPGKYTEGVISINCTTSSDVACPRLETKIDLTVFNVELPSLAKSRIGSAWYYPSTFNWSEAKYDWYDLMIQHRMPPDDLYIGQPREYEEYAYMASKGVRWFNLLDVDLNAFGGHGPVEAHNTGLEKDNLLASAYVYGFDEVPNTCEPAIRQLFGAVKNTFPKLKTAAALNWESLPVDLPVDIWINRYDQKNVTNTEAWINAGKVKWQYHCIAPDDISSLNTFIERPGLQSRLMFWLASLNFLKYGAPTGWLYWAVNLWRPCDNPLCTKNYTAPYKSLIQNLSSPFVDFPVGNYYNQGSHLFTNGDGQFIYPCENGLPCGSIRLSNLRDGLEDWDGLFSIVDSEFGIPLIEEMVRDGRDWEFTGERRMEQIRTAIAQRISANAI